MARKIEIGVALGTHKETVTEDLPDDWDSMTEEDRELHLSELAAWFRNDRADAWAVVVEEDE